MDKNPLRNDGLTPLHCAAKYGHLAVYQLIMKSVLDKNPRKNAQLKATKNIRGNLNRIKLTLFGL